ncbi:MAG: hypothetical protein ACLP1Q_18055 [Solirubrobacteraceae bacterium]
MASSEVLAYVASAVLVVWGVAHLAPTRAVVDSFGGITRDERRILAMEWIAEGITHISLGVLVVLVTAVEGAGDPANPLVYRIVAGVLLAIAALTAATGSRTPVIWFRVCPFVLGGVAALLVLASIE